MNAIAVMAKTPIARYAMAPANVYAARGVANARIVTAPALVPNAAVMADRDMGTYSVGVVTTEADGTTSVKPVEVTVGLKDSRYTEITSGLAEGDVVVLGELDAPTISFGQGTRSPFGGN